MKSYCRLTGILLATMLHGCAAPMLSKQEAYPGMYEERPGVILVLPAINQSTAAEAADYLAATLAQPVTMAGYYVLPIELTTQVLQENGVQDGTQLADVPAQYFAEYFGADAVLFVTITQWDTSYFVIGGSVSVGLQFALISTRTGETLWHASRQSIVNTGGGSGNLLADILVTALKTSTQDYVPIARQINTAALHTIPAGRYSASYDKDREWKVVPPAQH